MTTKLGCLFLLTTLVHGQDVDTDKLVETLFEKTTHPFAMSFDASMSMPLAEVDIVIEMTGDLRYQDPYHVHLNMRMEAGADGNMNGGRMIIVGDGEALWVDISDEKSGEHKIVKTTVAKAYENLGITPEPGAMPLPGAQSPTQSLAMLKQAQLKLVSRDGSTITLEAPLDNAMLSDISDMPFSDAEMNGKLVVIADETEGFPLELTLILGETPFIKAKFTDFKDMRASGFPEGTFTHEPKEGVEVEVVD